MDYIYGVPTEREDIVKRIAFLEQVLAQAKDCGDLFTICITEDEIALLQEALLYDEEAMAWQS